MIFIDLKNYNKVSKNIMLRALEKKRVPTKYIILIKNIYTNIMTSVRAYNDESDVFIIMIKLQQGSTLSLYIFTLVMNDVTKDIQ
jgi:Reverse transcriptase (RNA-dependent DNA polymerase)